MVYGINVCCTHFSHSCTYLSLSCPHPLPPFLSVRSPCWLAHSRSQPAIRQLLLLRLESVVVSLVSGAHLDPHWLQPTHSPGTIIQLYVVCRYESCCMVWGFMVAVCVYLACLDSHIVTWIRPCSHLTIFCTWDISLDLPVTLTSVVAYYQKCGFSWITVIYPGTRNWERE